MPKRVYIEIVYELVELMRSQIDQTRDFISLYQPSVYKCEVSSHIERKIKCLHLIAKLLEHELILDHFEDYRVSKAHMALETSIHSLQIPMIQNLLQRIEKHLSSLSREQIFAMKPKYDLRKSVQKFRHQILSEIPASSTSHHFFRSL